MSVSLEEDQKFMRLALREARKGLGRTSPNPCVGALIVRENKVIATGYHRKAGTPHAEIHALRRAGELARGATIYVTLEPCNHTGRTPPCSRAVAQAGISRAVVGMEDPNPLVAGSGNEYLRSQGVQVLAGIMEKECRALNRPFIKHITTALPWVILKAGISLDGRITYQPSKGGAMTGPDSWRQVHRLRNRVDAILIGTNTALIDNPSLTTRLPQGRGRDPLRVLLDSQLLLPETAKVLRLESEAETWVFCGPMADPEKRARLTLLEGVEVFQVQVDNNGRLDLLSILEELGRAGVNSLLVEGGAAILGAFLREKLADQLTFFLAPVLAGDQGLSVLQGFSAQERADAVSLAEVRYRRLGEDMMIDGEIVYP
ncbi:MAG: bifunctional diaminohydroxyphosphoribosylaminopyrimidine deaminase/5-amino-6-(5-phosphoribosylamino)uracil reductase RibD [Desulfobulbaceae bacterium]|uniref:Riboflavin biosynthesis protein RibD n=1 Tax=Candidatus Desulfatifera sulfidica TaxID=2841691 RepID=A0A8J6TD83_9BACT|nr:bifunctional diaminohydroxyphosphoribosylaminopyrimidine deaminase/5-amino-6-(5-phosphoribosylamino)uracil reductase RibD [Candidatus Desulfatifera sulfidica]